MAEPTGVLTFKDFILDVVRKLGWGSYGADGDEELQLPDDVHDLAEAKRIVNEGIQMFIGASPKGGWRWMKPTADIVIWGTIATDSDNKISSEGYDPQTDKTTLTVGSDSFYASMEEKSIVLTGVDTFTIADYVSATKIKVRGDATGAGSSGVTWSMTADGNYTLPKNFGGMYEGRITYEEDTNQGVGIDWASEAMIRQWRENVSDETGDPYLAAIRIMDSGQPRRRWELMVYPQPDEILTVQFPYNVYFDELVDLDDVSPAPFFHDHAVRYACRAVAEMEQLDAPGPSMQYFQNVALPQSHEADARSAPRKLGYFGNPSHTTGGQHPIHWFRQHGQQRPDVTYNTS